MSKKSRDRASAAMALLVERCRPGRPFSITGDLTSRASGRTASGHPARRRSREGVFAAPQERTRRFAHTVAPRLLVEPATTNNELFAEISDVRDRSAEAGDAQLEDGQENFEGRT